MRIYFRTAQFFYGKAILHNIVLDYFRTTKTQLSQLPLGTFTLEFHHVPEQASRRHKLRRGALLCHTAVLQHHDMIRTGHGAHPVGDDQHRLP